MDGNLSHEDIARKIIEAAKRSTDGINDNEVSKLFSVDVAADKRYEIINQLIDYGCLRPENSKEGIIYKYQDPAMAKKFAGLEKEDMDVFAIVSNSKTSGVTSAEIRPKTGKSPQIITKILKKLEKKGVIKAVKSVHAKNRNLWILAELEPTEEITGGIWYRNNEFDKDLIDALYDKAFHYIASQAQQEASKKEIGVFLRSSGMGDLDLKDEHIQSIINILIYDDKIEEVPTGNKANPHYKISDWDKCFPTPPVITLTPCGTCPLFMECKDGGIISPQTCLYFNEW